MKKPNPRSQFEVRSALPMNIFQDTCPMKSKGELPWKISKTLITRISKSCLPMSTNKDWKDKKVNVPASLMDIKRFSFQTEYYDELLRLQLQEFSEDVLMKS